MSEVVEGQLGEGRTLQVMDADGVEGDVDFPCFRRNRISMLADRLLVESIDLRGLGATCTHELDASRTLEEVVADLIVTSDAL